MPEAMFQVGAALKVESAQIKPGIGPNNISGEPYPSGYTAPTMGGGLLSSTMTKQYTKTKTAFLRQSDLRSLWIIRLFVE